MDQLQEGKSCVLVEVSNDDDDCDDDRDGRPVDERRPGGSLQMEEEVEMVEEATRSGVERMDVGWSGMK
ncbi:hypothetical protein Pcinc_034894 [Petrolisthes cinctipes]|uniref:Uncharacterized protein n=1 Tax=Petrolisthes cinctipes TaxID=88211 RepID=A0AAE1BZF2_PETCI|nr:hypothetical protein Pcinc_034894 [Petrolisthes cinctipes]